MRGREHSEKGQILGKEGPNHGNFGRSNVAFVLNIVGSYLKALTCIFKKIALGAGE